jgi:hypothetical protein
METLGEALPKEMARVRELIKQYRDPNLGGAGEFAARMMEQSLKTADEAAISGDVAAIIAAYNDLQGFTG